jgi:hypothetical protein
VSESTKSVTINLSYLPGAETKGFRPGARTLGRLARDFREYGVPPLPRPTVGLVEGCELPLLYPGLNGLGGPAGTAKSVLTKYLERQQVWTGRQVLVLDCETSEEEYAATMVGDFTMGAAELDLVHYVTDDQRREPGRDRWSGRGDDKLAAVLDEAKCSPSLVIIDSQSKSMALLALDENRPVETTKWYEAVAVPIVDRWPEAAVVSIQGRQKGWQKGMDVRGRRGSSALLHEVHAQYMVWTKKQGSRTVDGLVEVVCTKCRYGHRVEGSMAAEWRYGPSGFSLRLPDPAADLPDPALVKDEWLAYLASTPPPRDSDRPDLPVKRDEAIEAVAARLEVTSAKAKARKLVDEALTELIRSPKTDVHCRRLAQGVPGVRPWRVWRGDAHAWDWSE